MNHDHMLYCSLDMARIGFNCYFSFWAIFYLFTSLQALHTLFHIEVAQIFQKGASSRHLKQLSLEQDPRYNTRLQDNMLQNRGFFYHKSLKTHCTFHTFQQL